MHRFFVTWALALVGHGLILASGAAAAQGFQNLDQIDTLVATTVGVGIGQPGGANAPVDRRLRLAACPNIPSIEGPVFGAAIVRCDKLGWRIRVPLKLAPQPAPVTAYGRAPQQQPQPQARTILIKKGDPVQLVAGNASFSVSRQTIADEDGAVGEMIRVRGDKTAPPVSGRIEPDGIVRVPGI
ncbi:flagella basal body P-ring formation protein FlgA [Sphingobium sufflavum]|uniref:flagella basal body P-ring formation protein FlgA n=1 Tax=Sphingobium sufflavum TaxID=1129547 RepID=UPI001F450EE9|nr:flagella basal body P-ring formation protein FlgA [Sphingobium sufflavum]MCE7797350.1 flagella basal body P-ring formation protein FlgA [Sphingobium sufflavum]